MRILFVNRMLGIAWGGGENYDYNLASALSAQGHSVSFLGGLKRGGEAGWLDLETEWVETPYWRHWMYRWGGRVPLLPGAIAEADLRVFQRAAFERVRRMQARQGFDLVQVLGLPQLARWIAEMGWRVAIRYPGPPAWFQRRMLTDLAGRREVAIFTHGDTVRFLGTDWGLPVREVRPGVRDELFRPLSGEQRRAERSRHGWTDGEFVIASVGRMVPGKGHEFLVGAMGRLRAEAGNVRLVLAGDGPLRPALEEMAGRSGVEGSVDFLGHLHAEEVARVLGGADVFALCSGYENFSNAVLEAMSAGLPVVAPRLGGFALQIEDGRNGFLIRPGDETDFCARIRLLQEDAATRARLAAGAREYAACFSWNKSAAEVAGIYEQLLRN
jgi:glycosyltransferase involved in cell wall biosynthesis